MQDVEGDKVTVSLHPLSTGLVANPIMPGEVVTLPIVDVQKLFKAGDFAVVKSGEHCGKQGWVIQQEQRNHIVEVLLHEYVTSTPVTGFLGLGNLRPVLTCAVVFQFTSVADCLSWQISPVLSDTASAYCPSPLDLAIRHHTKRKEDWDGLPLRIVKGNWKGYQCTIRSTHKVFEKVELAADFFVPETGVHSKECIWKCNTCTVGRPCNVDHKHCPPCYRAQLRSIEASRMVEKILLEVMLEMTSNNRTMNIDICDVRPAE